MREDRHIQKSSTSESDDENLMWRRDINPAEYPQEYWEVQKLIKYLHIGNPAVTLITLCSIMDFDLSQDKIQMAVRDAEGVDILLNILDTEEPKCKMGALKILKELCKNQLIRKLVVNMGGLKMMAHLLRYPDQDLQSLSAECIAKVVKFHRARKIIRQEGAIEILVSFLDKQKNKNWITLACSGARALWSCSQSQENRRLMKESGIIPLLAALIKSQDKNLLIPVAGILQECASEESYKNAIRTEGMLEHLIRNLSSDDAELQKLSSCVIFKCAEEKETRDLMRTHGGLDPLVSIINSAHTEDLLAAATGAIWKCSLSPQNVVRFQELKAIDLLVNLLNNQPENVLTNVAGALAELARDPANRIALRKANGIPPLVLLLSGTNDSLLINVTYALGQCAEDPDCMMIIDKLDGVRLLWSLLKNHNRLVQTAAAWALCPCIHNVKDPGEMVRSFVGGLELIVCLLKSEDLSVLTAVCGCIAEIAQDKESLAVLTDHGVVSLLSQLTNTNDLLLRYRLSDAIAQCCSWNNNKAVFGQQGAVKPLVGYLTSKTFSIKCGPGSCKPSTAVSSTERNKIKQPFTENKNQITGSPKTSSSMKNSRSAPSAERLNNTSASSKFASTVNIIQSSDKLNVFRSTAAALYELSKYPENCVVMHEAGVVKPLLELVGSADVKTQEAAASCLLNIRRLATANEKARQRNIGH